MNKREEENQRYCVLDTVAVGGGGNFLKAFKIRMKDIFAISPKMLCVPVVELMPKAIA